MSHQPNPKPSFATNRPDRSESVAGAVVDLLQHLLDTWQQPPHVEIATAYFNPPGFAMLADQLEQVEGVRLLLGAEPEAQQTGPRPLAGAALPQQAHRAAVRRALEGHQTSVEQDRDLLGFQAETDVATRRLIAWLRSGRVEVKRYSKGFLHGKAFLVSTNKAGVIAGSANFTRAGLAFNRELMLGHYDAHTVEQVHDWFTELWDDSDPYDLAAVYEARYREHQPHTIYLRMLYERYGAELLDEAADAGRGMQLTTFQQDGVWRARRILDDHHGVVVADGVGLGKTYVAGALIREWAEARRQRVLIIAPAALRDGPWDAFLTRHELPRSVQCISYEELAGDAQLRPGGTRTLKHDIADYGLIVIDEAHAFRNPDAQRADALRRLIEGSPPKDVVMLTATPVNNSLFDLYHLLSYFVRNDAAFAHAGIRSLREHFAEATAQNPEDLSPERLFDVLDAVAVRRTRNFVKTYYPHDRVKDNQGNDVPIRFPAVNVVRVAYDLEAVIPGLFGRLAHALAYEPGEDGADQQPAADAPVLSLGRYSPSKYRHDGDTDAYQLQVAGLLRSGLLKRFESSSCAFAKTCRAMAASHDKFLALLNAGRVATGSALADWTAPESDEVDDLTDALLEDSEPAAAYDVAALRADVEADRDLLVAFAVEAEAITPDVDPKLDVLIDQLADIAAEANSEAVLPDDARQKRKVIVFSYYTDTVEWIARRLHDALRDDPRLAAYRDRMITIDGSRTGDKTAVLYGFAPVSTEAPAALADDKYDLLITTDVLAEGVNLQQARHIINYDLPWNPMRLVQRHGRIDRIGSPHLRVFVRCFFPDRQLDTILQLEDRLKRKLHAAAAAVGVESEVLPGSKVSEVVFSETRDEIERLRREDGTLLDRAGERGHAYSGEEYRQELRRALQSAELKDAILGLPWGSGSGLARAGAEPGFVFCARVGDHPNALFRYVGMGGEDPVIHSDTLGALANAHATEATPRSLGAETNLLAYRAWEAARGDIYEAWMAATDPRALAPKVPKVLREAAQLLRDSEPTGMSRQEIIETIDALEGPYPPRIQGAIRIAMRSEGTDEVRAARVAAEARRLGLQPSPPPDPLPLISVDDVHLVCWQAIVPAAGT